MTTSKFSAVKTVHHTTQDKKTKQWYNPDEQFKDVISKPETKDMLKRLKNECVQVDEALGSAFHDALKTAKAGTGIGTANQITSHGVTVAKKHLSALTAERASIAKEKGYKHAILHDNLIRGIKSSLENSKKADAKNESLDESDDEDRDDDERYMRNQRRKGFVSKEGSGTTDKYKKKTIKEEDIMIQFAKFKQEMLEAAASVDEWNAEDMIKAAGAKKTTSKGTRYTGAEADTDNDEDDGGKKKAHFEPEKVKKGRGRPAGSKSGARSLGKDGGTAGGSGEYHLALPSKSVYY